VFALLVSLLDLLDGAPARAETLRVFELQLLEAEGLRPELAVCLACGGGDEALDQPGLVFDVRRGGVVCGTCHGHGRPLDGAARRALVRAQGSALADAPGLALPPSVNASCRDALVALICDHLGRPLRSLEFIAKLNGADAPSAR
jgi:recombinational DNA repair protein (RecF pathway)